MKIKTKIILVVLPILVLALSIAGISAYFSASSGIQKLARELLGFKVEDMRNFSMQQWNTLNEFGYTDDQNMLDAAKDSILVHAQNIISRGESQTEKILALNQKLEISMSSKADLQISAQEKQGLKKQLPLLEANPQLLEISLDGKLHVCRGFYFAPFEWYVLVTEEKKAFFAAVNQITWQTMFIIVGGSLFSIILLIILSGILTRPLKNVVKTMQSVMFSGDLSLKVAVEYNDEIGELSHAFNLMIEELEGAYNQIKTFAFKAVLAQKKEQKIRNIFQKYVPQDLIDKFFSHPESMLVGNNRVLAILFSDIRSFTTISERMQPDDLVNCLNRYFSIMVDIIMEHNGIVDKYIGDAIMAFFGAPVKRPDDAYNSVLAGLEMLEALEKFNQEQQEMGKPDFRIGIGINYGIVTVGNIGSEKKMDYTVIGDEVNLASRMEGLTKMYKQPILISESLNKKIKNKLDSRLMDTVAVKGKTKGVKIYTVSKNTEGKRQKIWKTSNKAMQLYYNREFQEALRLFDAILQYDNQDYHANLLKKRCQKYLVNPPAKTWDGIEIMQTK